MAVFHFYQLDFLVVLTIHGRSDVRACDAIGRAISHDRRNCAALCVTVRPWRPHVQAAMRASPAHGRPSRTRRAHAHAAPKLAGVLHLLHTPSPPRPAGELGCQPLARLLIRRPLP
jgi:hypothetical protein